GDRSWFRGIRRVCGQFTAQVATESLAAALSAAAGGRHRAVFGSPNFWGFDQVILTHKTPKPFGESDA
ncbi:MAG: hypothetical protein ACLFQH_10350, partial [Halothiobacillaceae bacterium]